MFFQWMRYFWKIGKDGCQEEGEEPDTHLHLEIKTKPIVSSPLLDKCFNLQGKETECVGYTSDNPTEFGYLDPLNFIFEKF